MARSAAARMFKGSAEPAVSKTLDYVDQAVMQPEIMMRNPEERLMYHTRENQRLADMGMIKPSAILPKAYVDAQQAGNIIEGDIYDAYARDRLDPSIKEEVSLTKAGLDQSRIAGMTKGTKSQTVEGDNLITRQNYSTMEPEQRREYDAKFGVPTDMYGRLQKYGSSVIDIEDISEDEDDETFKETTGFKVGKYATNADIKGQLYSNVTKQLKAEGYTDAQARAVNNVLEQYSKGKVNTDGASASPEDLQLALDTVRRQGVAFDANTMQAYLNTMDNYNSQFKPTVVTSYSDGSATSVNLRRDVGGGADDFKIEAKFTGGGETTVPIPTYFDDDDNRYYEVPTNNGTIMIPAEDAVNLGEEMKRNYAKTLKRKQGTYLLEVGNLTGVVLPQSEGDINKVDDFYTDGGRANGNFIEANAAFRMTPEYQQLVDKDVKNANSLLAPYMEQEKDGKRIITTDRLSNNSAKVKSIYKQYKHELDNMDDAEEQAFIKFQILKGMSKVPNSNKSTAYMIDKGDGTYDVGVNNNRSRYLQKKYSNRDKAKMLQETSDITSNTDFALATPEGGEVGVNVTSNVDGGEITVTADAGELGKVTEKVGHVTTPRNTKAAMFNAVDKLNSELQSTGVMPKGTTGGEAATMHKVNKVKIGGN